MITEEEYLNALKVVKAYQKQVNDEVNDTISLDKPLTDIGLSTRAYRVVCTALPYMATWQVKNLCVKDVIRELSVSQLLRQRNCGKGTLSEIKTAFEQCGVQLKEN